MTEEDSRAESWYFCLSDLERFVFQTGNLFERYPERDVIASLAYLAASSRWKSENLENQDGWLDSDEFVNLMHQVNHYLLNGSFQ